MLKRILMSGGAIVFVGALLYGATGAFFSDTETSTGNTFSAGAIDLQIDNSSYGFDWNDPTVEDPTGVWGPNEANSWELDDLTNQLFFSFVDLKPGDYGEDTISVHVNDNDAWACMALDLTGTPENGQNEPEAAVDQTAGAQEGELQNYLSFIFWNDDGDNVLETGEDVIESLTGDAGTIFSGDWLAIADSANQGEPLEGGSTNYIGKGWCFGDITAAPVAPAANPNGPTPGNTGFVCDGNGEEDQNDAQTDGIGVDVSFYAVQSRNNADFLCSEVGEQPVGTLVGSNFTLYDNPNSCDVTADDSIEVEGPTTDSTISGAVAKATAGQTICVEPGTYNENVVVDKALTIGATGAVGSAIVNGGFEIAADNVTVKGFKVNGGSIGVGPTISGFFLMNGSDNVVISDNEIDGTGEALGSRGIINAEGGTFANVLIQNNFIHDWTTNIYMSTINDPADGSYAFTIKWNDLDDALASIGQLNEALVTLNEFSDAIPGAEAIGAGADYDDSVISFNNFLAGTKINDYTAPTDIEAPNNFFNVSAATQAPVNVDTTPAAGAQYGHR